MAREFPQIVNFGTAFRFALEAEAAAADQAAAASALAPTAEGKATLEDLCLAHRQRVDKLTVIRQEVNEMILEPLAMDTSSYLAALAAEPADGWPAIGEQLLAGEQDAARFHEDFADHAADVLAASTRAFKRAARQEREAATRLRGLLA